MNYFLTKEQLNSEYIILEDYLYEKEAVFGCNKNNPELIRILNKAISSLNKKKTMEKIYQKWFGISPLITKRTSSDKMLLIIKYILFLSGTVGFSLYFWNRQLKKEVDKKTTDLNISKNELETVFNGLTHLLAVVDSDCFITDANKTFCEKYNLTLTEIKKSHCKSIKGIMGTDCNSCVIKYTFDNQCTTAKEIKSNGRIFKVSTYLLDQLENTKQRVLVMMEDITDFKITEQKMLQSTKLAAIGQLAAGIAHEIRTPLSIIRSHSYYLKKSDSKNEQLESMKVIEESVGKANKIIDNLLNFSRLTDNSISIDNIKNLISDIIDLNSKSFKNKKISTKLFCSDNLEFPVNGESLKHILINLINNSVDAMPEGGLIEIHVDLKDNALILSVADTGTGMTEETIENIFNPFFTTKPHGKGTGLGLYITYSEIQKMDGILKVDSTLNKGSIFTIILPNSRPINN